MNLRILRPLTVALLAIVTAVALPAGARADDSSSNSGRSDVTMAAWNATTQIYQSAAANRALSMKVINEAFATAVKRAKKELTIALAKPVTPAQKRAATARFRAALDRASEIRQAALDALPDLPAAPGPKPRLK